jgi:hypothetical protein
MDEVREPRAIARRLLFCSRNATVVSASRCATADRPLRAGEGSRGARRFLLSVLRLGRLDVRLAEERCWHSIGRARRCAIPDTGEMPTVVLDPLMQAILCLGGLVAPGADPVVVLLGEAAASYL